jgi:hypothetical protein
MRGSGGLEAAIEEWHIDRTSAALRDHTRERENMDQQIIFGFQERWQAFQERNEKFLSRFISLQAAFDVAFARSMSDSEPIDRVVYMLGRLCVEDFFEIILLAGNGYGIGALKLLRGLYERAVTLGYLSEHPSEVDLFLNYHLVHQHKLLGAIKRTFGDDALPAAMTAEQEQQYEKVKDDYRVTVCKKCGTTRVNNTWKLDLVSMAHETGILGRFIVPAYYEPLSHVHTTPRSITARLEETSSGGMGFNPDSQPKEADNAVRIAHTDRLYKTDLLRSPYSCPLWELGLEEGHGVSRDVSSLRDSPLTLSLPGH